ncbi:MAG: phosphate signaling complex protein PhoU, partial [Pseudomonadota bacterium]
MDDTHIASAFDRDLEGLQAQIMKMGGLVEDAILKAATSLEKRDEELAQEVARADTAIDQLEELISEEVARIIALRQPIAVDLRIILTALKVSSDLERIGDYAKNMAKRTTVLAGMHQVNGSAAAIRRMAKEVERMLKDALDAYIQRDAELAHEVILRDTDV